MNELISEIISAIIQIVLFSLIPFIVFVIKYKKVSGFPNYIGFIKPTKSAIALSVVAALFFLAGALALVVLNDEIRETMINPPSITGKLRLMGLQPVSLAILLIIACFKTSLAEEIFFRGFIAQRLMDWLGYFKGNVLQSLIFAATHLLLFWAMTKAELTFLAFIFVFTGTGAYLIGYIKEKKANKSIIPGWVAHGIANIISYSVIAFVI